MDRLGADVRAHLAASHVTLHPYSSFSESLPTIVGAVGGGDGVGSDKIMVEKGVSMGILTSLGLSKLEITRRVKEVGGGGGSTRRRSVP